MFTKEKYILCIYIVFELIMPFKFEFDNESFCSFKQFRSFNHPHFFQALISETVTCNDTKEFERIQFFRDLKISELWLRDVAFESFRFESANSTYFIKSFTGNQRFRSLNEVMELYLIL